MAVNREFAELSFDPSSLDAIDRSVERVRESGRTRWIALVVEGVVPDPLRCYAFAGARDRFYWMRSESDEFFCSWGSVAEIETEGPERFRDVRAWTFDVRDRLDWAGETRTKSAPLFMGGFGFAAEMATCPDWKNFPPARFVLPEVLVERGSEGARWILFVRIEPGANVASVELDLQARHRDAVAANNPTPAPAGAEDSSLSVDRPNRFPPGPEYLVRADRSHAVFRDQIKAARREIKDGRIAKVVLARSLCVEHDDNIDVASFLERLRPLYPTCTLVAIGRAHDTFLAATPETLIQVKGRSVVTAALAGSAPRGREPDEDRLLGEALLGSEKEIEEHGHVVEAIRSVLAPRCDELEMSESPQLRQLFGIQHLETSVHGRLKTAGHPAEGVRDRTGENEFHEPSEKSAVDILELVEALHPTPAVGGVPAEAASAWLQRFEGLDRGWYAAPIGWLNAEGGGDFSVALRSALIRNELGVPGSSGASRAVLFAGVGIVAGSEPESELAETRVKLRALLAPMTEI